MGCSRFPKNRRSLVRIRMANFRPWQVEHFQSQERRLWHDDLAVSLRGGIARCAAKRMQLTVISERGVKSHQIFHCDFGPAQRKRQTIKRFRARQFDARAAEEFIKRRVTQLGCKFNRWKIAAARERVARADRADEFAIEIFRIVIAETVWRIRQDRQWMNQSLFQSQRIDERFQSGTGRARRTCSIHLSLYFGIE